MWHFKHDKKLRLMFDILDSCLICLRLKFDMSGTHVRYVRLMFDMAQTHVWYTSVSCLSCLILMFVWDLSNNNSLTYRTASQRCIKQFVWDVTNSKMETYLTGCLRFINSKSETYQTQVWDVPNTGLRRITQQIWDILKREYDTYQTVSLRHIKQEVWHWYNFYPGIVACGTSLFSLSYSSWDIQNMVIWNTGFPGFSIP